MDAFERGIWSWRLRRAGGYGRWLMAAHRALRDELRRRDRYEAELEVQITNQAAVIEDMQKDMDRLVERLRAAKGV